MLIAQSWLTALNLKPTPNPNHPKPIAVSCEFADKKFSARCARTLRASPWTISTTLVFISHLHEKSWNFSETSPISSHFFPTSFHFSKIGFFSIATEVKDSKDYEIMDFGDLRTFATLVISCRLILMYIDHILHLEMSREWLEIFAEYVAWKCSDALMQVMESSTASPGICWWSGAGEGIWIESVSKTLKVSIVIIAVMARISSFLKTMSCTQQQESMIHIIRIQLQTGH